MSHVTDIILIDSGFNYPKCFRQIYSWLYYRYGSSLKHIDANAGGNKVMQCDVYVGAFNHMDITKFVDFLNFLPWDNHNAIQLLMKDEHDEKFILIK